MYIGFELIFPGAISIVFHVLKYSYGKLLEKFL